MKMVSRTLLPLIAVAALALAQVGCSPTTVSLTLFADNSRLSEATVLIDKGAGGAKVAQIDVRGLIADYADGGILFPTTNPVDDLTARLRKAQEDPNVKAVVLRINSPGGTVTASDMMYREVRRFARESGKPVVASLGEVAASGGYYLAMASDRIVAEPTSITGSIGVIMQTINVSEGLGRIGIRSRSVTSRANKDIANPLEPMREEHYAILQGLVDEFYGRFRGVVVERRGRETMAGSAAAGAPRTVNRLRAIDMARLDDLTDGRVFTGARAVEVGLADQMGGIPDAFGAAKELAGLKAATLVKYYREDQDKPRSAYAGTAVQPAAAQSEINLLQIRMSGLGALTGTQSPGAYYLWVPPGG